MKMKKMKKTNREMLMELKRVEPMRNCIKELATQIVKDTYDYHARNATDIIVSDGSAEIEYDWRCMGEDGHDSVRVPIDWFDEGFDYKSAYEEMKRKEAEEAKKRIAAEQERKAAAKKAAAERKAKKEYETYLKLKQKYQADPRRC